MFSGDLATFFPLFFWGGTNFEKSDWKNSGNFVISFFLLFRFYGCQNWGRDQNRGGAKNRGKAPIPGLPPAGPRMKGA